MCDPKNEYNLRTIVNEQLEKKGSSGFWLWKMFFLCLTPIILNGFHVNSYVFLAKEPTSHFCQISELSHNEWTEDQQRNFTSRAFLNRSCNVLNYNYTEFKGLSFEDALEIKLAAPTPDEVSCKQNSPTNAYLFSDQVGESMVSEFELICENLVMRSNIQLAISLGKFVGSFTSGVIADKFGRKLTFVVGGMSYLIFGFASVIAKSYWLLFVGRFGIGFAAAALFLANFTLLTENISQNHRSWMSIIYTITYPIGMVILAIWANYLPQWRHLQLALIAPGVLLLIHFWFLDESPRWLISKNRDKEAYKILFRADPPETLLLTEKTSDSQSKPASSIRSKIRASFNELSELFGARFRIEILICFFTWCITSTTYYVTALSASFGDNLFIYVLLIGIVDIPTCILPIVLFRFIGRRVSGCGLYLITGAFLLLIPFATNPTMRMVFALCSRFGVSAVYVVITLHTAEIFPTEVRSSALGICGTIAHVGSIIAPYIVDLLGLVAPFIPSIICGSLALVAGLLVLLLPETRHKNLSDDVVEDKKDVN